MLFRSTFRDSFSVFSWIVPIPGTRTDSTIFWYSPGQFFGTLTDFTYSWLSHGIYRVSVLTKILPFPILAQTFFRYSHRFYLFRALARILPFADTQSDNFLVLSRILHIPCTRTNSTVFRYFQRFYLFGYSPGKFFGTLTDSTYSRYSHGFYYFPVLKKLLPFLLLARTVFRYSQIGRASCRERV